MKITSQIHRIGLKELTQKISGGLGGENGSVEDLFFAVHNFGVVEIIWPICFPDCQNKTDNDHHQQEYQRTQLSLCLLRWLQFQQIDVEQHSYVENGAEE